MLIWIILLIIAVLILCHSQSEHYSGRYYNSCEMSQECLGDTARWCSMDNGQQGNCTLHGLCCPAFSMDHSRDTRWNSLAPINRSVEVPKGLTLGDVYLKGQ